MNSETNNTGLEVAVIGMAARFPGAGNVDEYWDNVRNGRETIRFYTDEEMEEAGVEAGLLKNPDYIKAAAELENIENFDAAFFGYSPAEAQIMDPQMRFLHEVAWDALEDAGYVPEDYEGLIGMYSGAPFSMDWVARTMIHPRDETIDDMNFGFLTSKDHLSTRISYLFNLKGPSFTFYSACSTSLVGIHLACQGLLSGECDMALAGGVSILLPQRKGYLYREDMVYSKDGHVRPFDTDASGIVGGNGIGIVVLKPLEDAVADGDHIYAIVKGTGINNDGSRKIGYTAPSITGQEVLFREVREAAEIEAESITFVECHGTATPLGDPVEIAALTRAFDTGKRNYCALGSVKSNMGHTDSAAGVAGFIKAVLALYYKQIPPTLHFRTPNPKLEMHNSPFYVNTELIEWRNEDYPLRAAVNSLGLGGTNAHAILQEAPVLEKAAAPDKAYRLYPVSARTPGALEKRVEGLAHYLEKHPGLDMAQVAYTLQEGRSAMRNRRAFVSNSREDLLKQLREPETAPVRPFFTGEKERSLVFMFSGQGSQYVNMGLDLYKTEEKFRKEIDHAFEILKGQINEDLKYILYPETEQQEREAEEKINRLYYTQPVKFIFEYTLARLLMSWGLEPRAMVGHSFGEYVLAALAGVFTLEDALKLVMIRGEEFKRIQPGQMLSVALSEEELRPLLPAQVAVAAVNTTGHCMVAGPLEAVEAFGKQLENRDIDVLKLRVKEGGHSQLMDPLLESFRRKLSAITFNEPRIPYISGVTGTWITAAEATDPDYWTRHLRHTVRFADALNTLFETPETIFIQVGPGKGLINFVNYYKDIGEQPGVVTVNMVRHPKDPVADDSYLLTQLGRLWSYGRKNHRKDRYGEGDRRRCRLPGYPFESQYYWIDLDPFKAIAGMGAPGRGKKPHMEDWFYVPTWKNTLLRVQPGVGPQPGNETANRPWLIFMDPEGRGNHLLEAIKQTGREVLTVWPAKTAAFEKNGENRYSLEPTAESQYGELFKELKTTRKVPETIIHLWNLSHRKETQTEEEWHEHVLDTGYYSLLEIARAVGRQGIEEKIQIEVVANGMHSITGGPLDYPEKATLVGPVKNIPQEYPNIKCRLVEIQIPQPGSYAQEQVTRQLIKEFATPQDLDQVIAYRGNRRLVQTYEPAPLEQNDAIPFCFRQGGVYLVVGGLGGVGLVLSSYLARTLKAKLILTARTGLPPREQWQGYVDGSSDKDDKTRRKIIAVLEMERQGGEVLVYAADVADEKRMRQVVATVEERFGKINGIIHSGFTPDGTVIDQRTRETSEAAFAAKITGTRNLDRIFREREPLDFYMLCSSLASILAPLGQVGYTAANAFQDAFAYHRSTRNDGQNHTVTLNWCGWAEVGGAVESVNLLAEQVNFDKQDLLGANLLSLEGEEAFLRVMASGAPQVLVSTEEFSLLKAHLNAAEPRGPIIVPETKEQVTRLKRPQLTTEYKEPENRLEKMLAQIWQDLFGYETVGVQDDFFEMGGDSLKAMIVSARLHKELKKKIPIAAFFNEPTIEGLVRYFGAETGPERHAPIPVAAEKDYYPVAPVQEPLFHQSMKDPENTDLNIVMCFRLEGGVGIGQIEQAFGKMIERHEIYRASFLLEEGRPVQRIQAGVEFRVERIEKPGATEEQLQEAVHALVTPFDLRKAPLFKVAAIITGDESDVLVINTHQLLIDGTTAVIFIEEFMELLNGQELAPLKVRYRDYAQWQHDRMATGEYAVSKAYWLEQFRQPVKPLELPTDFPRPAKRDFEGRSVAFTLEESIYRQMQDLAKSTGTTMFMIWSAAIGILLHKAGGQEDIVMGSRLANRLHSDLEEVIGKFSNTLTIRSSPQAEKTFREYLEEVKELALGAFRHQEYPFEMLLEQLEFTRDEARNPLFDTIFVYNNMATTRKEKEGTGTGFRPFAYERVKLPYDLYFQANEYSDYVIVMIQYPTALFKEESIKILIENLLSIFMTAAENSGIRIADIKIVLPRGTGGKQTRTT